MVVRRWIGAISQLPLVRFFAKRIQDDSRLHAGVLFKWIELEDLIQVFREVDDYSGVAALARQAGAPAAPEYRRSELAACGKRLDNILIRFRYDNADRDLAIVRTVGGIQRAVAVAEAHCALNPSFQIQLQVSGVRRLCNVRKGTGLLDLDQTHDWPP